MNEDACMQKCEKLARQAAERGDAPVGAIIVRDGKIVAQAGEANKSGNDITRHAEIEAIRQAVASLKTNDLSNCVMYSTHEPCVMCSYAIRFHKISKVVYRHTVPYLGGITSSMPVLLTCEAPPSWGPPPTIVHLKPPG